MEYTHKPVLLDACIQALDIRPDGVYVVPIRMLGA